MPLEGARIVLYGMISRYHDAEPPPGLRNIWEAIIKRATLKGFMFSDHVDRYPEAFAQLAAWLNAGQIRSFDEIENTPAAFCGLFRGANRSKLRVRL